MHDPFDVPLRITARFENRRQLLQIGDSVDVVRRLFGAEFPVQMAAHGDVARVSRQLADIIDVVDNIFQAYDGIRRVVEVP